MAVVNLMSENEDEEDWMKYASAGFGQTNYSLWDEQETTASDDENDEPSEQEILKSLIVDPSIAANLPVYGVSAEELTNHCAFLEMLTGKCEKVLWNK